MWFITRDEYRLKSAKGRVHRKESKRKQIQVTICPLPSAVTWTVLNSPSKDIWQNM